MREITPVEEENKKKNKNGGKNIKSESSNTFALQGIHLRFSHSFSTAIAAIKLHTNTIGPTLPLAIPTIAGPGHIPASPHPIQTINRSINRSIDQSSIIKQSIKQSMCWTSHSHLLQTDTIQSQAWRRPLGCWAQKTWHCTRASLAWGCSGSTQGWESPIQTLICECKLDWRMEIESWKEGHLHPHPWQRQETSPTRRWSWGRQEPLWGQSWNRVSSEWIVCRHCRYNNNK